MTGLWGLLPFTTWEIIQMLLLFTENSQYKPSSKLVKSVMYNDEIDVESKLLWCRFQNCSHVYVRIIVHKCRTQHSKHSTEQFWLFSLPNLQTIITAQMLSTGVEVAHVRIGLKLPEISILNEAVLVWPEGRGQYYSDWTIQYSLSSCNAQ